MRIEKIVDIVYSSYIEDYFLSFILVTLGYFVVIKFMGYVLGNIPFIKKIFLKNSLLNYLLLLPILIGINKIVFNIDNANYFLEYNLFLIIFISISILAFIYSGTKQVYSNFTLILLAKTYKVPLIIILIISSFYAKNYFYKNYNSIESRILHSIERDLRNIKVDNKSLYRIAKSMTNHYIKTTNQQLRTIEYKKENILALFNEKIQSYNIKYEKLTQLINESRTVIKTIERRYEKKIDIVDSEIDNKKLKLDSIYKEWVNNVENNIENLDNLVKESKEKMQLLNNNKKIMSEFRNDLNLLDKKLFDINASLISEKENNVLNNTITKEEHKKSLEKFSILQKNIKKYQDDFMLLEKDFILIKEDVGQSNIEILDIKNQMKQKIEKEIDKDKITIKEEEEKEKVELEK